MGGIRSLFVGPLRTLAGLAGPEADSSDGPIVPEIGHGIEKDRIVVDPVPAASARVLG